MTERHIILLSVKVAPQLLVIVIADFMDFNKYKD